MTEDCQHGMNPEWCSTCRGDDDRAFSGVKPVGVQAKDPKQAELDKLCKQLKIPTVPVAAGNRLPSQVFEAAARQCGVVSGTMPEIGKALAEKAGLEWTATCAAASTSRGRGDTVTQEGLTVINKAVSGLLSAAAK